VSEDLEYRAAQRRANLAEDEKRRPPRQTWVTGKVTQTNPVRVTTTDQDAGYPAQNMTNGPLHTGQPCVLLVLDGGVRLVMGARYLPGVVDHHHDNDYEPLGHDHDDNYATWGHEHDNLDHIYSIVSHTHGQYAEWGHSH